jgi:putative phosphoribosyl transferase
MVFQNRQAAGTLLAQQVDRFIQKDIFICALARGGVVVASRIAQKHTISMYVLAVKKLRAPQNPELAVGAITFDGIQYIDADLVSRIGVTKEYLDNEVEFRQQEAKTAQQTYPILKFALRNCALLVDDGVATGATVLTARMWLKERQVKNIILAVPVIAKSMYGILQSTFDAIVSPIISDTFQSVGQYYKDFPQVTDEEVKKLL